MIAGRRVCSDKLKSTALSTISRRSFLAGRLALPAVAFSEAHHSPLSEQKVRHPCSITRNEQGLHPDRSVPSAASDKPRLLAGSARIAIIVRDGWPCGKTPSIHSPPSTPLAPTELTTGLDSRHLVAVSTDPASLPPTTVFSLPLHHTPSLCSSAMLRSLDTSFSRRPSG